MKMKSLLSTKEILEWEKRERNGGESSGEFVLSTRVYFDARLIDLLTVAEPNISLIHSKYFQLWCRQLLYTVRSEGQ